MATNGITIEKHDIPKPWRSTPLVRSTALSRAAGCNIYLKLENLQPSGSFKSRGIGNFILQKLLSSPRGTRTHFYSSSGGNAGLACVHAAVAVSCDATIVVPLTTSAYMMSKMRVAGAKEVIQIGESWADADAYLRDTLLPAAREKGENAVYVSPFDHPDVWTGNATMVDEILEQFKRESFSDSDSVQGRLPDAIVCSVGGGGMFCGIMQSLDRHGHTGKVPVLALETNGADSLAQSVQKGEHITLAAITSIATTLGARKVAAKAFEDGQRKEVKCIVLEDSDAVLGCLRFADEERILVEPSCGVCIAMCYEGRLEKFVKGLTPQSNVVIVVCGGTGVTIEMMEKWRKDYL